MEKIFSKLGEWSFCKGHECPECESPFPPADRTSIESWLQSFKADPSCMAVLRRIVGERGDNLDFWRFGDDHVVKLAAGLIEGGFLRVCSTDQDAGEPKQEAAVPPQLIAADRVIRSLRQRNQDFIFEGSWLRLIRTDQWPDVRETEEYRIVPRERAKPLLEKMADASATLPAEKPAFQEASTLVPDTSRRQFDSGLLLLQKIPKTSPSKASSEPAMTPSQLAKVREKDLHWIEIELFDEDNVPVSGEEYLIVTPDGQEHTGTTDEDGWARLDGIDEGQCKISFPQLDGNTWKPSRRTERTHSQTIRHTVKQGECLSLIAAAYDFVDWRDIYNDSANAEFRKKRPNPHVLFPGDVITIPDRDLTPERRQTDKRHRFVLRAPKRKLNVLMLDEFKSPMKDEPYTAVADDVMFYGKTDGKGILELKLPYPSTSVEIWIAGLRRTLNLGELNPLDDAADEGISGVQGRLLGLGFDPGPIDGIAGPRTRAALIAFQRHFGLKRTGEMDGDTLNRLKTECRA